MSFNKKTEEDVDKKMWTRRWKMRTLNRPGEIV